MFADPKQFTISYPEHSDREADSIVVKFECISPVVLRIRVSM
jgi:hypothetical protein